MVSRSVMLALAVGLAGCGASANGSAAENGNAAASVAQPAADTSTDVNASGNMAAREPSAPLPATENASEDAPAAQSLDRTNTTGAGTIRPVLIQFGTIDGAAIKDFQLRSRCQTAFVTTKGPVVVDWTKVGNFAEHDEGNRVVTPIDDGHGSHDLSLPKDTKTATVGDVAALVNMGLSGIADGCAPN
ncbi:hypothetical protein C8J44_0046 [Sphingomonas sp. PP-CE-3A-406]|uniref:hypothetical protein n=1 Tax=Sphingomonas sp. PP-CE-3A-406 TaxID=2135659 RepID=UPI000F23AF10|nr:hypothetical protein [Sphingomonas sp. PP-CE-3A-406]RMB54820.1 hypothetical protein C8J44_0046 [Sphingomonas sp. PP-CE-3A-406]